MMALSRSPTHQFSIDKRTICSIPLSSTLYCRIAPFTINARYLHTSPSCKKYCLFLNFFRTKVFLITSSSLSVSGVLESQVMYFKSDSCIDLLIQMLCDDKTIYQLL